MIPFTISLCALGLLIIDGVSGTSVSSLWVPGSVLAATLLVLLPAVWKVSRYLRDMEQANKDTSAKIGSDLTELRHYVERRFDKIETHRHDCVSIHEFARWVAKFRRDNPAVQIPDPFNGDL